MEGCDNREKKAIRDIVEKRLGNTSGAALDQYQDIFLHIARHVIPRYERTRVVQLMKFDNDEWVLVCSCPFLEKMGEHVDTCTKFWTEIQRCAMLMSAGT